VNPVGEVVELEIPPTMEYLDLARVVVSAAASVDPSFSPTRVSDLRLAVSELCANAIESHQRTGNDEPLLIRCDLDHDRVTIEIEDHGGGFDPDDLSALPQATDPARLEHERGLGISLVKSLADDVQFLVKDDGTTVRVVLFHPNADLD
jgi:stage II sporulation protein AB (anti-sigma F factor)